MSEDDFYCRLPSFRDFGDLTKAEHFMPVPSDWVVFISDVAGSTRAIEAGRYKDVNTVGAACIASVLSSVGTDLPYVFGGDGATILAPAARRSAVASALQGVADLAARSFDLHLRVGAIGIEALLQAGGRVEVARHELSGGRCVALFRGGGLTLAERLIKADPERYACAETAPAQVALTGLSCRWQSLPAERGLVLSLLVQARPLDAVAIYDEVLAFLRQQLGGPVAAANPVRLPQLRYRTVRACWRDERRYHRATPVALCARFGEILAAVGLLGLGLARWFGHVRRYAESMRPHSDHRKFDDMLRLVVDCSLDQLQAIETWLAARHRAGRLYYGLHRSADCLMTCYVEGLAPGQHIHFVDGGDGGYAMAAKQLKAQLAS